MPTIPCARKGCGHDEALHTPFAGCLAETDNVYCACGAFLAPQVGTPEGRAEGIRRADEGAARVLSPDAVQAWKDAANAWLDTVEGTFTSDDLTKAVGMPPSPNAVGAALRGAAKAGRIRPSGGYVQSTRPSCHGAVVRVWTRA